MVYGWLREASGSSGGQARSGRGRLTRAGEDGGGGGKGKRAASTSSANPSARGGRCPAAGARDKSRGIKDQTYFSFLATKIICFTNWSVQAESASPTSYLPLLVLINLSLVLVATY
jgi:hypothetical protein